MEWLDFPSMKFDPESSRMPEMRQYQDLIMNLWTQTQEPNMNDLLEPFQKLEIGIM